MSLLEDLTAKVTGIAGGALSWNIGPGRVVPDLQALPYGNTGKTLAACIMYADLSDSTGLVRRVQPSRAAEYYKAFLHCASKLITSNDGVIEAYDGDRVMGVFLGADKETRAVKAGAQLKRAMDTIVNPIFRAKYGDHEDLVYTVGIDSGDVLVCKAGVRGEGDLVWIGPAANVAAKLNSFSGLDHAYPMRITQAVFDAMDVGYRNFDSGGPAWSGPYGNLKPAIHYRSLVNTHI